ncbi:hypothetical protein OHU52_29840 [Pseudomonas aeruginosa]|uniref:hypothetical protein n=1 Tax=Pseudomonas aeruginosa TaxID=287 RepID=UPI0021E8C82A|nr:hypothetical protein [Pseudomonas aeruginosa]MCV3804622.1 hypothetical protein [Pseudomonas aeruginosa]MCV3846570.1 hypothetical protein [Pseudomonas aeruginosa]MCV3864677.1 hypothetical protein [Pseudomonas aeruginosa]MCV3984186.1 hypothetical protein [Pseudomonas aeruginosa]MCV3990228.1 hypothetical protein [Pseudomonas aeruginosa]
MSIESSIAALVTASNNLTGAVSGKMGQIDAKVAEAQAQYQAQLDSLASKLPRLGITRNFSMGDPGNLGRPDNFGYHTEVSWSKVKTIVPFSQATGRTAEEIALLAEIEADVKEVYPDFNIRKAEYYRRDFSIWQGSWAVKGVSPYFIYPQTSDSVLNSGTAAIPLNSFVTVGAFVRVLDGEISGSWATGAVKGKWRWCSYVSPPVNQFGTYTHLHPQRISTSGTVQMALIGACTGVVTHPGAWGGMLALG